MELGALSGQCECGRSHFLSVRGVWIGDGELNRLPDLITERGWKAPVILCDQNTWEAAGRKAASLLPQAQSVVLKPKGLHADEHGVEAARTKLPQDADVLIAAGAGTIHDITRFLAHERELPFLSIPTAASVDGFVSTVAAMTWHGCKKTMPAQAPKYVLADSGIFAAAPGRLTASGVSDLLGKFTALADWRIASAVTGEYLCERICGIETQALIRVCASLDAIAAGEKEACEGLMYGLLLSGLAMQMMGNSRPASGAEHHLSHLWEMEVLNGPLDAYHGEKVGVGLLLATGEYHAFARALEQGTLRPSYYGGLDLTRIRQYFCKPGMLAEILEENMPDPLAGIQAEGVAGQKDKILMALKALPAEETLRGYLKRAKAPVSLSDIGLPQEKTSLSMELSPYVRNRLTLMRLLKLFQPAAL